jgi:Malectin domain
MQGSLVASNYDIYRQAGSQNAATVLQQILDVSDNNGVTIEMVRVIENPAIMGIEIIPFGIVTPAPTPAPTAAPISIVEPGQTVARINAGGQSYVDSSGNLWSADKFVLKNYGQVYTTCPNAISNTIEDTLYCSQRWFSTWSGTPYVYSIPIASSGVYEARLHFAEIVSIRPTHKSLSTTKQLNLSRLLVHSSWCNWKFFNAVGARVFDVYVEGVLVRDNLDVYSVSGGLNVAHLVTVPVSVSDGAVTIELVAQVENPFISAIEVVRLPNNSTFITAPTAAPTPFQTILINCGGMVLFYRCCRMDPYNSLIRFILPF